MDDEALENLLRSALTVQPEREAAMTARLTATLDAEPAGQFGGAAYTPAPVAYAALWECFTRVMTGFGAEFGRQVAPPAVA